jgi:hypothetical protein
MRVKLWRSNRKTEEEKMSYQATDLDRKITSYTVNLFYKALFKTAKEEFEATGVGSISSAYRNAISCFVSGLQSGEYQSKSYKSLLEGLNGMFTKTDATHTVANLMQKITEEFVPSDFTDYVPKNRQNALMFDVIVGLFENMRKACLKPKVFQLLVDTRGPRHDADNQSMLAEICYSFLHIKRGQIIQRFLRAGGRKEDEGEKIDKKIAENLQARMWQAEKLLKQKEEHIALLESELNKANMRTRLLIQKCRELQESKNEEISYAGLVESATVDESPPVEEPLFDINIDEDTTEVTENVVEIEEQKEEEEPQETPESPPKSKRRRKRTKKSDSRNAMEIDVDPFGNE